MKPTLVLVGRPNVGKSSLFNRLSKTRDALVADFPGLTRDRRYGLGRVAEREFLVVDTAGFDPVADGVPRDLGADRGDDSSNLVARHHGIHGRPPIGADMVDVGVADAAVFDLVENVVGAHFAAGEFERGEGCPRGGGGVAAGGDSGLGLQVRSSFDGSRMEESEATARSASCGPDPVTGRDGRSSSTEADLV